MYILVSVTNRVGVEPQPFWKKNYFLHFWKEFHLMQKNFNFIILHSRFQLQELKHSMIQKCFNQSPIGIQGFVIKENSKNNSKCKL